MTVTYDGRMPLAVVYIHHLRMVELRVCALGEDRFDPMPQSWQASIGAGPVVAATVDPAGRISIATGDQNGRVEIWRRGEAGTARSLAVLHLNSMVQKMAWTATATLVVWCRLGVVRINAAS